MLIPSSFSKVARDLGVCLFVMLSVSACQDLRDNPLAVSIPPDLLAAVLESQQLANIPLDEEDRALVEVLRSSAGAVEISIPQVASELVAKASRGFRRIDGTSSYSKEELTRIRRLASGAEEALEQGDYPGAIRRAYYACQLLGIGL